MAPRRKLSAAFPVEPPPVLDAAYEAWVERISRRLEDEAYAENLANVRRLYAPPPGGYVRPCPKS